MYNVKVYLLGKHCSCNVNLRVKTHKKLIHTHTKHIKAIKKAPRFDPFLVY